MINIHEFSIKRNESEDPIGDEGGLSIDRSESNVDFERNPRPFIELIAAQEELRSKIDEKKAQIERLEGAGDDSTDLAMAKAQLDGLEKALSQNEESLGRQKGIENLLNGGTIEL